MPLLATEIMFRHIPFPFLPVPFFEFLRAPVHPWIQVPGFAHCHRFLKHTFGAFDFASCFNFSEVRPLFSYFPPSFLTVLGGQGSKSILPLLRNLRSLLRFVRFSCSLVRKPVKAAIFFVAWFFSPTLPSRTAAVFKPYSPVYADLIPTIGMRSWSSAGGAPNNSPFPNLRLSPQILKLLSSSSLLVVPRLISIY